MFGLVGSYVCLSRIKNSISISTSIIYFACTHLRSANQWNNNVFIILSINTPFTILGKTRTRVDEVLEKNLYKYVYMYPFFLNATILRSIIQERPMRLLRLSLRVKYIQNKKLLKGNILDSQMMRCNKCCGHSFVQKTSAPMNG